MSMGTLQTRWPAWRSTLFADGFFHVGTWLLVLAGSITMLAAWRQGRLAPGWSYHFGLVLAGWGIFNVVEGIIDRQLLGVHHVRDDLGGPVSWDIGFLIFGLLLMAGGWALHTHGQAVPGGHPIAMTDGGPEIG